MSRQSILRLDRTQNLAFLMSSEFHVLTNHLVYCFVIIRTRCEIWFLFSIDAGKDNKYSIWNKNQRDALREVKNRNAVTYA